VAEDDELLLGNSLKAKAEAEALWSLSRVLIKADGLPVAVEAE
jgi:hypothetical protein